MSKRMEAMAVESTLADTPESLSMFQILRIVHGLAIEINTGMQLSRGNSALKQLNQIEITINGKDGKPKVFTNSRRTKKGALKDLVEFLKDSAMDYKPSGSVQRALAKNNG